MSHPHPRYAVFGNPIHHSKSPLLQMAFAKQTGTAMSYTAECVEVGEFATAADAFFADGGFGLNVTVPFKLDAFEYAHELTERAQVAGAVNTLIKKGERIIGDNTDGVGLLHDIVENLQWPVAGKTVLVLGAGGAVRGILQPLLNHQPQQVIIANRTLSKAQALAEVFSGFGHIRACAFEALGKVCEQPIDMIINGTSASLGGELPDLPAAIVGANSHCYDMMYGKEDTVFIQWCQQHGVVHTADGLGMLICQGAESFFQWHDVRPETQPVIASIRAGL